MIMQLLLMVLCVGWVLLAMVFGILPSAPLIVGAMEALPGLALTSMLTEQLRNLGKGLNLKQSAAQSSTEKSHTFSVQTLIEWFNRKIPESMACLDAEVEEDVCWNVGCYMLRLNPGTVLMKVFVQTWAFLGCICLVSPMNAWALRRGARAVLAKKRMSEACLQR